MSIRTNNNKKALLLDYGHVRVGLALLSRMSKILCRTKCGRVMMSMTEQQGARSTFAGRDQQKQEAKKRGDTPPNKPIILTH